MARTVLLLGRTPFDLDQVRAEIDTAGVTLLSGTSLEETEQAFAESPIDAVIMGAGIDLATRLQIVEYVFTVSSSTTVHMKDRDSGKAGMMPFVEGLLKRL